MILLDNISQMRFFLSELDGKIPGDSYWKYCHLWSNTTSWISFLASLTIYLDTESCLLYTSPSPRDS